MAFEDVKDQLVNRVKNIVAEIRESSLYLQGREKFESFSPLIQKLIGFSVIAFVTLVLLALPLVYLDSSSSYLAEYEEKKELVVDLLRLSRNQDSAPDVPNSPTPSEIKSRVSGIFNEMGIQPDQIKQNDEVSIEKIPESGLIPANINQAGVQVTLVKLNLRQVVDLGHKMQSIPNTHMISMDMTANAADVHYYDVKYRIVGFSVPEEPAQPQVGTKKRGG